MTGFEIRVTVAAALLAAVSIAAIAYGAWLSRHTRRQDAQIDLDADEAAELRAERRDDW